MPICCLHYVHYLPGILFSAADQKEMFNFLSDLKRSHELLMNKLMSLCPQHQDYAVYWEIKTQPFFGHQCCSRKRCLEQAKELADAVWLSTLEVLLAQLNKHGKIVNTGGVLSNIGAAVNEADVCDGNGLRCMAWQGHLAKPLSQVLSTHAAQGKLCFRAAGVSSGLQFVNYHAWWQIYKAGDFKMTTSNHSISLDPWPSGGRSLIDNSHTAGKLIEVYSYYD